MLNTDFELFQIRDKYALYIANTNTLSMISSDLYEDIAKYQSGQCDEYDIQRLKEACHERDLYDITSEPNTANFHSRYNEHQIKSILHCGIRMMSLSLTNNCNMSCTYCCYHDKQQNNSNSMSWNTAKAAIDLLLSLSQNRSSVHIGFYGGEALLEFDMIKKCVLYAKQVSHGKEITFGITTNGILLNNTDIQNFLADNNFSTLVSLDGPATVNDRYRISKKGSGVHDIVINNLRNWYIKNPKYVKQSVGINAVLAPPNSMRLLDDYFSEFPFDVSLSNLESTNYFVDNFHRESICRMRDISNEEHEFSSNYKARRIEEFKDIYVAYQRGKRRLENDEPELPVSTCIPGMVKIHVTAEGRIFPCEKVPESDNLCIGNVHDGLWYDAICDMYSDFLKIKQSKCTKCIIRHLCKSCYKDISNISCPEKIEDTKQLISEFIDMYSDSNDVCAILNRVLD